MVIPDFEIRINLENSNNSIWKMKSGSGIILEKNRAREERHRVGKSNPFFLRFTFLHTQHRRSLTMD